MQSFDPSMLNPRDPADGERIRSRYGLPARYILYVGTIQPRKNLTTLIEAYHLLRRDMPSAPPLVIVGRKGWLYDDLFTRIRELGLIDDVLFTGFVSDEELPYLFDGAKVFVYLSLFEGFGRPPLEAMACGVPVLTSDTTAIPEVVGDAGLTVAPLDRVAVADALSRLLADHSLAAELINRGAEQARKFSWERAARETLDVYRMLINRK